MTREQESILRDLAQTFADRTGTAATDMMALCKAVKIPPHDATLAIAGAALFIAMDLLHTLLPSLSPREFGSMTEQHFTSYLRREAEGKIQ